MTAVKNAPFVALTTASNAFIGQRMEKISWQDYCTLLPSKSRFTVFLCWFAMLYLICLCLFSQE